LISAIALFHSADVKGRTGSEAGTCWEWRLGVLTGGRESLIIGVTSLALRLCAGDAGDAAAEGLLYWPAGWMTLALGGPEPKLSVKLGLSIRGIKPFGMVVRCGR
jgi:hypothetical protein